WLSRPEALRHRPDAISHAYWLNVFNTLTIYQIVERDLQSVTDVPSAMPWPAAGFFAGTEFVLDGQALSLWEIGHERITHEFQDYRDFGALTMGIKGGPPARGRLYGPEKLGAQLDDQMSLFMMSEAGLHINADGSLFFNAVFDQYAQEFELYTAGASLCDIAIRHTRGRRQARLVQARDRGCRHTFQPLDWSLNGTWE
ncbi:MAG: DUF547 domain-containing protein, partial [Rhodobacterales bacterium]|nr:DUF547 domain-containing protein [Rhodobacterales bacterium]